MIARHLTSAFPALLAAFLGMGWSIPASATILNIPAITMVTIDGSASLSSLFGLLDANGTTAIYAAPVNIPAGQVVCEFQIMGRDLDDTWNMTARLMRKKLATGATGFGPDPQTMATVSTAGMQNVIQKVSSVNISFPTISTAFNYWVELEFFGGFYQALALRVVYKTTC